ncbi:hypothetical protein DICA2_B02300 [Diutina catenulata]
MDSASTSFNLSMELSTPIKKIKNLQLDDHLDPGHQGVTVSQAPDITQLMYQKGYSMKLTTNVLSELNQRVDQISDMSFDCNTSTDSVTERRNQRYSGAHRRRFNNMESISSHYAAHKQKKDLLKQPSEGDLKRRKTLTGHDRVPGPLLKTKDNDRKIAPSRRMTNLSEVAQPRSQGFAKPYPPSRARYSSLEMAGVKKEAGQTTPDTRSFYKTPCNSFKSKINEKSSHSTNTNQASHISQNNHTSQKDHTYYNNHTTHTNTTPSTQAKNSFYKAPSSSSRSMSSWATSSPVSSPPHSSVKPSKIPTSASMRSLSSYSQPTIASQSKLPQSRSMRSLSTETPKLPSSRSMRSLSTQGPDTPKLPSSRSERSLRAPTVPQPFSLYAKPTISSSQKSLSSGRG